MNNSRFRSFIWIPSYAIGNCSEISRSKWSILSLISKSNRTSQNKSFINFRCSNVYVLPMKKWSLKNIAWFHENLIFFVFYNEKWWWAEPHGKLLNVFIFCIRNNRISVAPRRLFSISSTWRSIKSDTFADCSSCTFMGEDAKHSIYLNHLAVQCIHLCIANLNLRVS